MNQLIGFTDGETTASYKYNAKGLRYEKTVDGQIINHVWDGSKQIIADVIDNQFYEADCYIRGTNLVAKYNYRNGDKSEYTYYTQNAHGDVVNLTDKDGKVTKKYTYDAFGVEKNIDKNDANAFRYCGEYYDTETGTIYLRARYYNPSTGRFISRDSFAGRRSDPLSLNLYTYCRNNPLRYVDPSGHSYATLPNGKKMSINSPWDEKQYKSECNRLSVRIPVTSSSSSQVAVTTAPQREFTPITGGLSVPATNTITHTTIILPGECKTSQKKKESVFTKIGNGISSFFSNTFGAEYIDYCEIDNGKQITPYYSPVQVEYVEKENIIINKLGDSSKPISVYCNSYCDDITKNTVGLKINICSWSVDFSIGLSNTGFTVNHTNGDNTSYYGYNASIRDFDIGCSAGNIFSQNDQELTLGGDASISGSLLFGGYLFSQGMPNGEIPNSPVPMG